MAKPYQIKEFDYPRTTSGAFLLVCFPNGERWQVPIQIVADDRDEHYKDEQEDTIGFIKGGQLDPYDLLDWAANNMNWEDLKPYAELVPTPLAKYDYEEGWLKANKAIQGEL
jgi:hypothetical protein